MKTEIKKMKMIRSDNLFFTYPQLFQTGKVWNSSLGTESHFIKRFSIVPGPKARPWLDTSSPNSSSIVLT